MPFQLLPTVDMMIDLYQKPRDLERFQQYLSMLRGDTNNDLALPISGFNPMAKPHLLAVLQELKNLCVEDVMINVLSDLNQKTDINKTIRVVLNLADDTMGAWTNRYTTDYDSKFRIGGLVNRDFCVAMFWASESFTVETLKKRTAAYVFRTIYWQNNPRPNTLKEHFEQEKFVADRVGEDLTMDITQHDFYVQNQHTDRHDVILNFLYGDDALVSLGYTPFGLSNGII